MTTGRYSIEIWTGRTIHAVIFDDADRSERCLCGMVGGISGKARRFHPGWSAITCKLCQRSPAYRQWRQEQGIT